MNIHSFAFHQLLRSLQNIQYGSLMLTTPDGAVHGFSGRNQGHSITLRVHDWSVFSLIAFRGDIGFASTYQQGLWDCDDLTGLFSFILDNETALSSSMYGSALGRFVSRLSYIFTRNTLGGSRKNIHLHYDLGNDFYKLWLDPSMTYSSALFDTPDEDLTTAQDRKYDRIIDRLQADSGTVLEIGCGWGGFAKRALQHKDFAIKGLTLSTEQKDYAESQLKGTATIALEDYRHQSGQYNHIVSIEMFEAVGEAFWPVYFDKVKSLLSSKGKAVIQTITIDEPYFERYKAGGDAIRSFVFPGGMLPSPQRFCKSANRSDLRVTDQFAFGQDYATTLERWLVAFDTNIKQVRELGFDESFIRLWRFYLTCCIASFRSGRINVMQMELQHAS